MKKMGRRSSYYPLLSSKIGRFSGTSYAFRAASKKTSGAFQLMAISLQE